MVGLAASREDAQLMRMELSASHIYYLDKFLHIYCNAVANRGTKGGNGSENTLSPAGLHASNFMMHSSVFADMDGSTNPRLAGVK